MTRWFRFYDDAVNDPKVQRLPGERFKAWVNLLCLASKNGGALPPLTDISFALRMGEEKVSAILNDFCAAGLLDPIEVSGAPMSYEPHNWNGRQFKSDVSNERVKRYRERQRNVTVAPPETETETDTESEQKKDAASAALNPEADYFRRVKEVCGPTSGGLAKKLLSAKSNSIAQARAAIEQASEKSDPREYLSAIIRSREEAECRPDRSF